LAIDIRTGIIAEHASMGFTVVVSDLTFPVAAAREEFLLRGMTWEDRTKPLAIDRPDDCVILGCVGPGPGSVLQLMLVDVATGGARRIPFRGRGALEGCFNKDRTGCFVIAVNPATSETELIEVDFRSGANRRLGGRTLVNGSVQGPALSPDGKTLAVLYLDETTGWYRPQLMLIDVASGEARPLGKPAPLAWLNWLPDGRSLIAARGDESGSTGHAGAIVRVDLPDGVRTTLVEGEAVPVLLRDGKSILFRSPVADKKDYKVFDLDTHAVRPFTIAGRSLPDYLVPTPSPDGRRLLMVPGGEADFKRPDTYRPIVVNLSTGDQTPVRVEPGKWMNPMWW
jgi:hypothetical protein